MRSRKLIVACALVAIGMAACGSSSKSSTPAASGSTGTSASNNGGGSFCDKAQKEAGAFQTSGFSSKSADELKSEYSGLDAKLKQLQSEAPSAIKDDFATYSTFAEKLQKTLADANYDPTKLSPTAFLGLYSPQTSTALAHISQYLTQTCHISPPTTG